MLGKLLKYDIYAVGKGWIIAMITMVITALCSAAALRASVELSLKPYSSQLWAAQLALSVIVVVGLVLVSLCFISVFIMIAIRFYKHLFTDEGYLTFTLPASRKQIFLSKTINAALFSALSFGVLFLSIYMFCSIVNPLIDDMVYGDGLATMYNMLYWIFDAYVVSRGDAGTAQAVMAVLILFANSLLVVGAAYFCITLGSTVFKRGKLIVSIGVFYLMYMVYSFAINVMGTVSITALLVCFGTTLMSTHATNVWFTVVLITVLFATLTLASLLYSITLNIIERKLNLA